MDGEVARLTPSGSPGWSVPSGGGGDTDGGGIVPLPGSDLVVYEYDAISDSGVRLKRFDPSEGTVQWETFCKPLGVGHSLRGR